MRVAVAIAPEVRELLRESPQEVRELLEEIHDEDLADLLEQLDDEEAMILLEQLEPDRAADVFERLDESEQAELVERFGAERLGPIVNEMAPDELTDLVAELPDPVGNRLLDTVHPETAAEIEELLAWPEDTAGGLMTTEFLAVSPRLTVNEVIEEVRRQAEEAETVYYVYGLDPGDVLVGVASLRDLILADGRTPFAEVMNERVITVAPETDQEEVARTLRKYDFTAMPVVDKDRKMLGVITVDDVIDVMVGEQTEDVHKLAGVEPLQERYFQTRFWTLVSKRAPWLAVLFVGQFFTDITMRRYDPVIQAVSQLTHFLPLLMSSGGNSGSQSATLVIRGLATGDVSVADWPKVLVREITMGVVLGAMLALLGAARVVMIGYDVGIALTIGVTLLSVVLVGCTVGATLPLFLRRVGLDPATSSAPFIATLSDVLCILLYFTVAGIVLRHALARAGLGG
jgi:magnesium transporter